MSAARGTVVPAAPARLGLGAVLSLLLALALLVSPGVLADSEFVQAELVEQYGLMELSQEPALSSPPTQVAADLPTIAVDAAAPPAPAVVPDSPAPAAVAPVAPKTTVTPIATPAAPAAPAAAAPQKLESARPTRFKMRRRGEAEERAWRAKMAQKRAEAAAKDAANAAAQKAAQAEAVTGGGEAPSPFQPPALPPLAVQLDEERAHRVHPASGLSPDATPPPQDELSRMPVPLHPPEGCGHLMTAWRNFVWKHRTTPESLAPGKDKYTPEEVDFHYGAFCRNLKSHQLRLARGVWRLTKQVNGKPVVVAPEKLRWNRHFDEPTLAHLRAFRYGKPFRHTTTHQQFKEEEESRSKLAQAARQLQAKARGEQWRQRKAAKEAAAAPAPAVPVLPAVTPAPVPAPGEVVPAVVPAAQEPLPEAAAAPVVPEPVAAADAAAPAVVPVPAAEAALVAPVAPVAPVVPAEPTPVVPVPAAAAPAVAAPLADAAADVAPLMEQPVVATFLEMDLAMEQPPAAPRRRNTRRGMMERKRRPQRPRARDPAVPDYDFSLNPNVLPAVRDAGSCGASYAVMGAALIESTFALQCQESPYASSLAQLHFGPVSAQELLSCGTEGGCKRGDIEEVLSYAMRTPLRNTESYPLSAQSFATLPRAVSTPQCVEDPAVEKSWARPLISSFAHPIHSCKARVDDPASECEMQDEEALARFVARQPATAMIDANDLAFGPLYSGSVVTPRQCSSRAGSGDTVVLLVGLLTDARSGRRVWKVQFPFGNEWGHDGFAYLSYGENTCGVANYNHYVQATCQRSVGPNPLPRPPLPSSAPEGAKGPPPQPKPELERLEPAVPVEAPQRPATKAVQKAPWWETENRVFPPEPARPGQVNAANGPAPPATSGSFLQRRVSRAAGARRTLQPMQSAAAVAGLQPAVPVV